MMNTVPLLNLKTIKKARKKISRTKATKKTLLDRKTKKKTSCSLKTAEAQKNTNKITKIIQASPYPVRLHQRSQWLT